MKCEKCGEEYEIGQWIFCPHGWVTRRESVGNGFPFTTSNITGKPMTFNSQRELDRACREHGVTHRPDVAWLEKRHLGSDRNGNPIYSEGSGMGLPGVWI